MALENWLSELSDDARKAVAEAHALAVYADFEEDADEEVEVELSVRDAGLDEIDDALDWARDLPNEELEPAIEDIAKRVPAQRHRSLYDALVEMTCADGHQNPDEIYVLTTFARIFELESE